MTEPLQTHTTSTLTGTHNPAEFAKDVSVPAPPNNSIHVCDVLLNNFQIKEKSYRVLLNCVHLIWERLKEQHGLSADIQNVFTNANIHETGKQRGCNCERQGHLANGAHMYGANSNILPVADVIQISKGLTKSASLRNARQLLPQEDTSPVCQYLTIHYAKRMLNSATDCNRYQVRHLTLYNSDPYIIRKWYQQLEKLLRKTDRICLRRLLVFINPYGGRKKAVELYERWCKPLIQLAGIDASCIITQRPDQIRDMLMSDDLSPYDAVCCVGGDGTVAEMLNGLIMRAMHDAQLDPHNPQYIPKPTLPVGIIPAGSTDTIAYSLHGTSDVQTAAIHLVLGQRRGLDVCSVRNSDGVVRFAVSVMGYGYLGDVAAKSEKYRWLGTKRYEYAGVKAFLFNRGYQAEIHVLLDEKEESAALSSSTTNTGKTVSEDTVCYAKCKRCILPPPVNCEIFHSQNSFPPEKKVKLSRCIDNEVSLMSSSGGNLQQEERITREAGSLKWRIIRGEFFMINGTNITCSCTRSPYGISPYCHLGDGYLNLVLVRRTNLYNNIRFLINTMGRNGDIRNLPFVEIYRTRQASINVSSNQEDESSIRGSRQPIAITNDCGDNHNSADYSSWNCDGEVINDLQITMTSHCQLVDIFMRGPQPFITSRDNFPDRNMFCCCKS